MNFIIENDWEYDKLEKHIKKLDQFYKDIISQKQSSISFDFGNLGKIDSSGIILLIRYIKLLEQNKITIKITNISSKHQSMLELYSQNYTHKEQTNDEQQENFFENIGENATSRFIASKNFLYFIGRMFSIFIYTLRHPSKMKIKAIINQMDVAAIQILPFPQTLKPYLQKIQSVALLL